MLVSPRADRQKMLEDRSFDQSGKLGNWCLNNCNISKLPPSFGVLVCSGYLDLSYNKLKSLPESFSEITVASRRNLVLIGNPQLTGVPENFPNVKGTVHRG